MTWYTWLEQGRPINVSGQVLDAVARTLKLDADRTGAPLPAGRRARGVAGTAATPNSTRRVRVILDGLDPLPAAVYNAR